MACTFYQIDEGGKEVQIPIRICRREHLVKERET